MADTLLQVRHLSCGYGDRPVLGGVSLEVREGDAILIVGPNGGGTFVLWRKR